MTQLSLNKCDRVSQIEWPTQQTQVSLQSKAIEIVTDFQKNRPLVIDSNTKAVEAEYLMKKAHVKLKLVLDENDQFIGTLSFNDLNNQEIIKKVASGDSRADLRVSDFMKTKSVQNSLDWRALESASLRSLIQFLASSNDQHILVRNNEGSTIRGLISASDIARALHLNVNLNMPVSFKLISETVNTLDQNAA
ncbi:CBS domain-containing protein [Thalassotalea piscium]|uniref:CBS-domain-containing membrane protein n=1 Tax=Thalassotalea piscium TaxID=1230533 RepID=A0A7X0NDZ5_9GAMM|nr:CBS domain-containing protein [Thalassotalea piscium]MBB6541691.1 CBS-domain-containing membrane protein [Thalassotalea piscium]